MIDPRAAWNLLAPHLRPIGTEMAPRGLARGRLSRSPVVATGDLPALDISALDGFAFGPPSAAGPSTSGPRYRIVAVHFAGSGAIAALASGEAARIMTGAAVPSGTRFVLGFEECTVEKDLVLPAREPEAGNAIRRRGEIFAAGVALLDSGARLTPSALALLASQGIATVEVGRRPAVEILVTGNEVRRTEDAIAEGMVRDSHSDFLVGELAILGISPRRGAIVADDREELSRRLGSAADGADVILTTGGVSMGDADLVSGIATELGFRTLFHGVAMQPGKPLFVAHRGRTLLFGLPGNPGSVMTSYWLFVRPALARLSGEAGEFWSDALGARMDNRVAAGRGKERFVPALARHADGEWRARSLSPRGSHDLVAFAQANALLRVPAGSPAREAGDECEMIFVANHC